MKKKLRILIFVSLLISAPTLLPAQGTGPGEPPHPNSGNNPNGTTNTPVGGAPIDGGLGILLILGAAYGIRKLKSTETTNMQK
jgi:hypothetical protein